MYDRRLESHESQTSSINNVHHWWKPNLNSILRNCTKPRLWTSFAFELCHFYSITSSNNQKNSSFRYLYGTNRNIHIAHTTCKQNEPISQFYQSKSELLMLEESKSSIPIAIFPKSHEISSPKSQQTIKKSETKVNNNDNLPRKLQYENVVYQKNEMSKVHLLHIFSIINQPTNY